jgi:hypothetical protein
MSIREIKIRIKIRGPAAAKIHSGKALRIKYTACKWLEHDIVTTAAGNGHCPASPVAEIHATVATPICAFV